MSELKINIPKFSDGDWIPTEHSARGKDLSPEMHFRGIDEKAVSLAITLDDSSHPLFPNYNHWLIWNLPVCSVLQEAVPKGETIESLGGAQQGIAYGKHCYKGPKPPFKTIHTYTFTVYALDSKIELPAKSARDDFLKVAQKHILQKATYIGKFQSYRK